MTRASRSNQRVQGVKKPKVNHPKSPLMSERGERNCQFTLQMRESLHRELARKALASDMTMRGYIMNALRNSGLNVTETDLIDRRRRSI